MADNMNSKNFVVHSHLTGKLIKFTVAEYDEKSGRITTDCGKVFLVDKHGEAFLLGSYREFGAGTRALSIRSGRAGVSSLEWSDRAKPFIFDHKIYMGQVANMPPYVRLGGAFATKKRGQPQVTALATKFVTQKIEE